MDGAPIGNRDTIEPYLIGKGEGSAYGGAWKPSKPDDGRFIGEPGSIKSVQTEGQSRSGTTQITAVPNNTLFLTTIPFHGKETDQTGAKQKAIGMEIFLISSHIGGMICPITF